MQTNLFVFLCALLILVVQTNAFSRLIVKLPPAVVRSNSVASPRAMSSLKAVTNDKGFWDGEWICADCGYVYDRDIDGGGLYFEGKAIHYIMKPRAVTNNVEIIKIKHASFPELKKGFICPQCSAPRKRYAKKVGDTWGVTRDGGDLPIYFTTFVGLAITTWFALVYVPTM